MMQNPNIPHFILLLATSHHRRTWCHHPHLVDLPGMPRRLSLSNQLTPPRKESRWCEQMIQKSPWTRIGRCAPTQINKNPTCKCAPSWKVVHSCWAVYAQQGKHHQHQHGHSQHQEKGRQHQCGRSQYQGKHHQHQCKHSQYQGKCRQHRWGGHMAHSVQCS